MSGAVAFTISQNKAARRETGTLRDGPNQGGISSMAAPNSGEHTPAHARRSNELVAAQHWYRGISAALATAPEDSPTAVACRALLPDVMYRIDKLLGDADEEG